MASRIGVAHTDQRAAHRRERECRPMAKGKLLQIAGTAMALLLVSGCASGTAAPPPDAVAAFTPSPPPIPTSTLLPTPEAIEVTFDDICAEGVRRVTIHAQLATLPVQMYCGTSCPIRLQDPLGSGWILPMRIDVGTGENQMEELPDSFSDGDLRIRGADGRTVGVGGKVSVTGWTIPFTPGVLDSDVPKASLLDCLLSVEIIIAQ